MQNISRKKRPQGADPWLVRFLWGHNAKTEIRRFCLRIFHVFGNMQKSVFCVFAYMQKRSHEKAAFLRLSFFGAVLRAPVGKRPLPPMQKEE